MNKAKYKVGDRVYEHEYGIEGTIIEVDDEDVSFIEYVVAFDNGEETWIDEEGISLVDW